MFVAVCVAVVVIVVVVVGFVVVVALVAHELISLLIFSISLGTNRTEVTAINSDNRSDFPTFMPTVNNQIPRRAALMLNRQSFILV